MARRNIAYWLLLILTAVIIGLTVAAVRQVADLNQLVTVFLTPIVGLVGTVLGFYFGGDKN